MCEIYLSATEKTVETLQLLYLFKWLAEVLVAWATMWLCQETGWKLNLIWTKINRVKCSLFLNIILAAWKSVLLSFFLLPGSRQMQNVMACWFQTSAPLQFAFSSYRFRSILLYNYGYSCLNFLLFKDIYMGHSPENWTKEGAAFLMK